MEMTAEDFVAAMEGKLSCKTYDDYAALLGVGRRSIVRYATAQQAIPESVVKLVTLLVRYGRPKGW